MSMNLIIKKDGHPEVTISDNEYDKVIGILIGHRKALVVKAIEKLLEVTDSDIAKKIITDILNSKGLI